MSWYTPFILYYTNRIEIILLGNAEIREGSTLATVTLGLDASQMASATDHWTQVKGKSTGTQVKMPDGSLSMVNGSHGDATKQKAAEIDGRERPTPGFPLVFTPGLPL